MSDQCATCGTADVILFTCGYCDRAFCTEHTLPHHSCEGLAHPGEGADEVTFEWPTAGHTGAEDPFTGSGFRAADDPVPTSDPPTPRSPSGTATPAVERVPRTIEGTATPAVRPAPRRPSGLVVRAVEPVDEADGEADAAADPPAASPSPSAAASADGGTVSAPASAAAAPPSSAPVRTMDATRSPGRTARNEPRTFREWLDQQTYVSLSVKTAALATVINGALYLGMMLTLYGLVPV